MNWFYLPLWSTRVIAFIALALLVLAVVRWRRERRGGALLALRFVVTIILLLVMLNPQSLLPRERTGKPKLVVLLHTSGSMATRDGCGLSRLEAALRVLSNPQTIASLKKEFILDLRSFDREMRPVDAYQLAGNTPLGEASDIGSALMIAASQ